MSQAPPTSTAQRPGDASSPSVADTDTHVLMVEDSNTHARILGRFLDEHRATTADGFGRFRVTRAKTLAEARALVDALPDIAVVSLDLTLPDSSGLDTYLQMREHAHHLPIVVMTGLDDDELAFDALRHGAQDYVLKSRSSALSFVRTLNFAIERHRLTNALEQAIAERDAHAQQLRDMVGMASHELLGPLTSIGGLTQTLAVAWDRLDDAKKQEMASRVAARVGAAVEVARSFLDVARTAEGDIQVDADDIDVHQTLTDVVGGDSDVTIDVPAGTTIHADRSHVQSCVRNLVSNARKYGEPPIVVSGRDVGSWIEVTVRDHGPGVPASLRDTLFDRYTHAGQGRSDSHGLGMFIVRRLVEANGGEVEYEEPPTGGAAFVLRFPYA